jgi:hypothetical protein
LYSILMLDKSIIDRLYSVEFILAFIPARDHAASTPDRDVTP